MNGVIPTLFINKPVLTTANEIAAYALKFLFFNPGWTSDQIEDSLMSMRKLRADYTEDKSKLISAMNKKLNAALANYGDIGASVTATNVDEDNRTYTINISIKDNKNNVVLTEKDISVKDGVLVLNYEYAIEG